VGLTAFRQQIPENPLVHENCLNCVTIEYCVSCGSDSFSGTSPAGLMRGEGYK
jgi:hypothetical protein